MKQTIALLSLVLTLGFGACSTAPIASKEVVFTPCPGSGPTKPAILKDSYAPGDARVVRIAH